MILRALHELVVSSVGHLNKAFKLFKAPNASIIGAEACHSTRWLIMNTVHDGDGETPTHDGENLRLLVLS